MEENGEVLNTENNPPRNKETRKRPSVELMQFRLDIIPWHKDPVKQIISIHRRWAWNVVCF